MLNQEDLNKEMADIGVGRFNAQWESANKYKDLSRSKAGQKLIRDLLEGYSLRIEDAIKVKGGRPVRWKEDIRNYNVNKVAFIALKTVLNGVSEKITMTSLSHAVGRHIAIELKCDYVIKNNPKGKGIVLGAKRRPKSSQYRHVQLSMRNEEKKEGFKDYNMWSKHDCFSCGLNLIELLRVSTNLIEYVYIKKLHKSKYRNTRFVSATKKTFEWIKNFNDYKSLMEPFWLPMVEHPVNWTNIWEGGYNYGNDIALPKLPLIKSPDKKFLRTLKAKKLSSVTECVNLIQSTPWEINDQVLDTVNWVWDNNVITKDLPAREDEQVPTYPEDANEDRSIRDRWARLASGVHRRNLSTRSKRMLTSKIIYLANKFQGERLFLPTNCDFRGRVYYIPTFLNPMGSDICRGLLRFWREEKVRNKKEAKWLAIHGSNCWGNDKVSLDEREEFSYSQKDQILRIAEDPKSNLEWLNADAPFSYLAFAFEFATFLKEGKVKTKLPCMMDATNNGLQILSILTRCEYGCLSTNVLPSDIDKPEDIYNTAKLRAEHYMRKDAKENHPYAQVWLDYGIDRSCLKRPCMTWSYGLTKYSCRQYITDWFEAKIHADGCPSPFDLKNYYKAIHYLSEIVWRSIEEILDLPKQCMNWLQKVSKIVSNQNRPIKWVTPSGFPVKQGYTKSKVSKIRTHLSGEILHINYKKHSSIIDTKKNALGISPNFVHSLDATLLHKTVLSCCNDSDKDIYDFSMVHDSFGTHSNKAEVLGRCIREQAVDLFKDDLLLDWLNQLKTQNPDLEFPDPPTYGSADISLIKDSPYFFS